MTSWVYAALVAVACWCALALLTALGWHLLRTTIRRRSPDHPPRGERL